MTDVTVTVPARPDFVRLLRTVVSSVGARLDLTYDRIDDLRIAVDEACAQLLAISSGTITMRVTPDGDRIKVFVCSDASVGADGWPPPNVEDSLAWRILAGLADDVRFELTDQGPAVRVEVEARTA
ncbi:MAG: ATP-binding protein [Actinomycetota bacterium]|nr:ATP-binding protein [Actinomycetota bacterium]